MATRSSRAQGTASQDALEGSNLSVAPVVPSRSKKRANLDQESTDRMDQQLMDGSPLSGRMLTANARKRKRTDSSFETPSQLVHSARNHAAQPRGLGLTRTQTQDQKQTATKTKAASASQDPEKRLRRQRQSAPQSFLEKLHRAQTQRMIVVGRRRCDADGIPQEDIDLVGSTGNMYRVTIGRVPSCTCPDHQKGHECKHKVYVMCNVLKAPEHLQYQLAYLSSELGEIFAGAPPIPTNEVSSADTDGKRKPIEGECPICYMDFDEEHHEVVWCKAACGNNMHRGCFDQWAASQRGATVKCVYCRTPWQVDVGDLQSITQAGTISDDGYVNVAAQFGMSRARDFSTYHQPWVRRQFERRW